MDLINGRAPCLQMMLSNDGRGNKIKINNVNNGQRISASTKNEGSCRKSLAMVFPACLTVKKTKLKHHICLTL
jgi:hypothetical protein